MQSLLRTLALLVAIMPVAAPAWSQTRSPAPEASEWNAYVRRYVSDEGRVIDTANRGISHSEGQGYTMFFAVYFDDRDRFERLWQWTRRNLSRPSDSLSAWRYDPNASLPVSDTNNASDGDMYIAWALARAADRWEVPEYRERAARIAGDLLRCCVTEVGGRTVLLPGERGFRDSTGVTVNLSYYAFPALRALSRVTPDRRWAALETDGLALMQQARFGRWNLPPDWLLVPVGGGPPMPASRWPARFSWDAIRVPLNLAWQGFPLPTVTGVMRFWSDPGHPHRPPAWVDLRTGETPPYAGHAGIRAVHNFLRSYQGERGVETLHVSQAPDYYGSALLLQSRIAPFMSVEEPALVVEATVETDSWSKRLRAAAQASMEWVWPTATAAEPSDEPPPSRWARPEFADPSPVRGVAVGPRGLRPPR